MKNLLGKRENGAKKTSMNVDVNFVNPQSIVKQAGIKEGDIVADFGCGPGYFSIPVADIVGENGKVYAFDILPAALEALESQMNIRGIVNIVSKRVNLEKINASGLKDESVDWVIMKNILFQNEDKANIVKEAFRILKPMGRVLIMEWDKNLTVGPPEEARISPENLVEIINKEGFIFQKQLSAGNYHYVIIAAKM